LGCAEFVSGSLPQRANYRVLKNLHGKRMDTIGDMLTSIRNGLAVKKITVNIPFSKVKFEIAKVLKGRGLVDKVIKTTKGRKRMLELVLKYDEVGNPPASVLRRISKPGGRIYVSSKDLKPVNQGYGFAIISTSKGIITDKEARQQNLGGEIICEIW